MNTQHHLVTASLVLAFILPMCAFAVVNTWDGSQSSDWFDPDNWDQAAIPVAGDQVIIDPTAAMTNVFLTNSTPYLSSFTITNAMLTFSNWTTTLQATNVTVQNSGVLTLPSAFTNGVMSNRVHIVCSNFIMDVGSMINADGKGFGSSSGPGTGLFTGSRGGGAGYGGRGGLGPAVLSTIGSEYGTASAPVLPGSGGGGAPASQGGPGGGAVRIEANGTVTVNGTITADGLTAPFSGGGCGSGGGVYITCDTFGGTTNGLIQARGGNWSVKWTGKIIAAAGAGGRIAIDHQNAAPTHAVRFTTTAGIGWEEDDLPTRWQFGAQDGTVWLSNMGLLSKTFEDWQFKDVRLYIQGVTSWTSDFLTVSNCSFSFAEDGFNLTVTNDITVDTNGELGIGTLNAVNNSTIDCRGNLILSNSAALIVYAGATNSPGTFGATVNVSNNLYIGADSWIYPWSHGTNGGSVLFNVSNLFVMVSGGINADQRGFASSNGPGAGAKGPNRGGGAGYGGRGGRGDEITSTGGYPCGSLAAPLLPGSGGAPGGAAGQYAAGSGGGLIRIVAQNAVTVNGTLTADGAQPFSTSGAAAGSGGAIYITCDTFGGVTNGLISVDGGFMLHYPSWNRYLGGGGGGGRIALDYQNLSPSHATRFSALRGPSWATDSYDARWQYDADDGTLWLPDTGLLGESIADGLFMDLSLYVSGMTFWAVDSLAISNCIFRFPQDGFQLLVTNNLILDNATLRIGTNHMTSTTLLDVGGSFIMTNNSGLWLYSRPTNGVAGDCGALVSVTGNMSVGSGSWVYPHSHDTNGGSVRFEVDSLTVTAGGGFYATGRGFTYGYGPGKGTYSASRSGGGGHGGKGGLGTSAGSFGGPVNGSSNAPVLPGSTGAGDGTYDGGHGGGVIWINAANSVTLNGTMRSDGTISHTSSGGGGAGGSIFVLCSSFTGGANGSLRACGAAPVIHSSNKYLAGGGGGGRVAVAIGLSDANKQDLVQGNTIDRLYAYPDHDAFNGSAAVTGGVGWAEIPWSGSPTTNDYAFAGTLLYFVTNFVISIEADPARYGTPLPDGYGATSDYLDDTMITNTVFSPVDQSNGLRHACFGWELRDATNGYANSSGATQAVFQLTTNLILTWKWTNEYQLVTSSSGNGGVNTNYANGWYTNNVVVTGIVATADVTYVFSQWTGTGVPAGQETDNPLTVTMDRARTIMANFSLFQAKTNRFNSAGTNDWTESIYWSGGVPLSIDQVIIESGTCIIAGDQTVVSAIITNGATLVFTNWTTTLTTSNDVTVLSGGIITAWGPFTNGVMSNRVHIICSNLTVDAGGTIDVDGRGYGSWAGPGTGAWAGNRGDGGGYGGKGGRSENSSGIQGRQYGSINAPIDPGSGAAPGGATKELPGGAGGGAVRIEASGAVTINGTITANGLQPVANSGPGGGSGGGIYITCKTFGGTVNGLIRANGGLNPIYPSWGRHLGGAGGGGRIAVDYQQLANPSEVRFATSPGATGFASDSWTNWWNLGPEWGTLSLSDNGMLSNVIHDLRFTDVNLFVSGMTSWAIGDLTIEYSSFSFAEPGFDLLIANDLTIGQNGELRIGTNSTDGNATVTVGRDFTLVNGGDFSIYSGPTNGIGNDYGALVDITRDMTVGANSWINPYVHETDGGAPLFTMRHLTVSEGGGFSAYALGYRESSGPGTGAGGGNRGGGGGHGGIGGRGEHVNALGGGAYDATNAPLAPGSGGYSGIGSQVPGGRGGGVIRIDASGNAIVNGSMDASGGQAVFSHSPGGGAGGTIYLICRSFSGSSNATLRAAGADYWVKYNDDLLGGGGGGGRIAIWYAVPDGDRQRILDESDMRRVSISTNHPDFFGTVSSTNGIGWADDPYTGSPVAGDFAQPGSIVFLTVDAPAGTLFLFR